MKKLIVRAYNVLQGDAILIKVPDKDAQGNEVLRHILIDVGNLNSDNSVYENIFNDVLEQLQGNPLDLYVMTHEHMDHVEGVKYAKANLGITLNADYAWLTASAAKDYYTSGEHPGAVRNKGLADQAYERIRRFLEATPDALPESRHARRKQQARHR